jgi:hypothetical protein
VWQPLCTRQGARRCRGLGVGLGSACQLRRFWPDYILPASLRVIMEIEMVESLDAADNGTARMDLAKWAAGRFLELAIHEQASGTERGNTRVYKSVPYTRPIGIADLSVAALCDLVVTYSSRVV